jgi:UDP-3-O-acyl-N-acetylglucosamine deacetylase
MVEHLLAAIYGLGIDNIEIKMNQSVVPAQDGSSQQYAVALESAEIVEQNKYRDVIKVDETLDSNNKNLRKESIFKTFR